MTCEVLPTRRQSNSDTVQPSLRRLHNLKVGNLHRTANVNSVRERRPLLALCSLVDSGHGRVLHPRGGCYVVHTLRSDDIESHRWSGNDSKSLQPLEDAQVPPREHNRIQEEVMGASGGRIPLLVLGHADS